MTRLSASDAEPYARVQRNGRWGYHVTIVHGLSCLDPGWYVLGRHRAERLAKRKLAKYLRDEDRGREVTVIRAADAKVDGGGDVR